MFGIRLTAARHYSHIVHEKIFLDLLRTYIIERLMSRMTETRIKMNWNHQYGFFLIGNKSLLRDNSNNLTKIFNKHTYYVQ